MPDDPLETELRTLGRALDLPAGPDQASAVLRRLRQPRRRPWRAYVAATIAAALLGFLVATPAGRAAVARVFRVAGIELRWDAAPAPRTSPAPFTPPGPQVADAAEAARRTGLTVRVPELLGAPDGVYVNKEHRSPAVTLHYTEGVAIDQFGGALGPGFRKTLTVEPELVQLGDGEAYWLTGSHRVEYLRADGSAETEDSRIAGNTLVWEQGGVAYRLEGAVDRDGALRIARSMR